EVLDRHVGLAREVEDDVAPPRIAQIDADTLLAHVDAHEVRGLVGPALLELDVAAPGVVALAGPLDLEDAGAEVGQQARAVGAGQHAREVEDGETVEQPGGVSHGHDPPDRNGRSGGYAISSGSDRDPGGRPGVDRATGAIRR